LTSRVVYGSPSCREVAVLRQFRDEALLSHGGGRFLVHVYYRLGPLVAHWVGKRDWMKPMLQSVFDLIVHWWSKHDKTRRNRVRAWPLAPPRRAGEDPGGRPPPVWQKW
jgi:hypothetical protein